MGKLLKRTSDDQRSPTPLGLWRNSASKLDQLRPEGNATGTARVIDEMITDDPLFVLGGGDYTYANRDGRYADVGDAIDAWFV